VPEKIGHNPRAVEDFITRWEASGSAERANYTMFLTELCALLGVPGPEPTRPDDRDNATRGGQTSHLRQTRRTRGGKEACPSAPLSLPEKAT
jgi:hypothetical protein